MSSTTIYCYCPKCQRKVNNYIEESDKRSKKQRTIRCHDCDISFVVYVKDFIVTHSYEPARVVVAKEGEIKKLKAYSVTTNISHEVSVLVFAENPEKARSIANNREEMNGYEYVNMRAKRAKYADGYEHANEIA